IFVHDVAGKQLDRFGALSLPNPRFKYLRTNRVLGAGNLITIEPGFYVIEMLLAPFRDSAHRAHFDWDLLAALAPFGGIRIEDDVLVTEDGVRNLTREVLP